MENKGVVESKISWFYFLGFCLVLTLPLLNLPPWFSPPNWGKTIVFRLILSILLFFSLWLVLFNETTAQVFRQKLKEIKNQWSFRLLLALLGVYFLATIFSQDISFSFWGSPYRGGGFLNFSLYVFFCLLAYFFIQKNFWSKIWNFSLIIGILVSLIAIFQQFGLFSDILIEQNIGPASTIGNPILLAVYLLLLFFPALSFGIKNKKKILKTFYFFCSSLFFITILITITRAAYFGLAFGFIYFFFFYPQKVRTLKILAGILLILNSLGIYVLNSQPKMPRVIRENYTLKTVTDKIFPLEKKIEKSFKDRSSGWTVAYKAIINKPIFGYGPENFSIGFDKYYDPAIPNITKPSPGGSTGWWDRAHSFIFDIAVTAGLPALIIYLSFFTALFSQLQKTKREYPDKAIICHGIQTTFLAYLAANFWSFDSFSSYIVLFLLIGYCLHLINAANPETQEVGPPAEIKEARPPAPIKQNKYKKSLLVLLFVALSYFIWAYNLKPLRINKDINMAVYWQGQGNCEKTLEIMDKVLSSHSYIDGYARLKYADIINYCLKKEKKPQRKIELVGKAIKAMEKNTVIQPTYTRNWWFLGGYGNYLIDVGGQTDSSGNYLFDVPDRANLKEKTNYYFRQANALSPKRQEILKDWIKTDILTGEYQLAKEKTQQCLEINPSFTECWWLKGLAQINLKETVEAKDDIVRAKEEGYNTETIEALSQLVTAYAKIEDYASLIEVYKKLINLDQSNFQYYASLAFNYKMTGNYQEARETAQKVIELSPESKESVEEFLKTLP